MKDKGYIRIIIEEGKAPAIEAELVDNTLWMTKYDMLRFFHCFGQKIEMNLRSIFKNQLLFEKDVICCSTLNSNTLNIHPVH